MGRDSRDERNSRVMLVACEARQIMLSSRCNRQGGEKMDDVNRNLHESFLRFRKLNLSVLYPKLSSSEMIVLKILREKKQQDGYENGVSVSEIVNKMCVAPPAVSRTLNSLEEKSMVVRAVNKSDRRNMLVQITELGEQVDQEADHEISQFMNRIMEQVGVEEIRQTICTLNRIYEISKAELEKIKKSNK